MQRNFIVPFETIRHCCQRSCCMIYNYKNTTTNINVPNQTLFPYSTLLLSNNIQIAIATSDVKNNKEVIQWITHHKCRRSFHTKKEYFDWPFKNSVKCIAPHNVGLRYSCNLYDIVWKIQSPG